MIVSFASFFYSKLLIFSLVFLLKIDNESTIWVLSNKMPRVIYGSLNFSENNFYIVRANAKDVIRGKKCNVREGIGGDETSLRLFMGNE